MLIIGYCMGIRSERRLCDEAHLNSLIAGFCQLALMVAFPTTRRSRRTVTDVSVTAISCATCSRRRLHGAWPQDWIDTQILWQDVAVLHADHGQKHDPGDEMITRRT